MTRIRTLLILPILLAACGGGAGGTNQPAATGPAATGAGSTPAGATQGTGATTEPGTAVDWCLNTNAEVEAALGVKGVTSNGSHVPGIGGGCSYLDENNILVHSIAVIESTGFESTFESAKAQAGAQTISGLGKDAVLASPQGPIAVLTDFGLISMGPLSPASLMADPAAYRTAAESLARSAMTRVP